MQKSFEEKVLICVAKIPPGRVLTYKEVARAAGRPRAARAVGNILNKNPFPYPPVRSQRTVRGSTFYNSKNHSKRVPCHRVVRSDGRVGGYSGPVGAKEKLLKKEGVKIKHRGGKIPDIFFESFMRRSHKKPRR